MRKTDMTQNTAGKTVSASDVEKYGYCPLSWWLSEQDAKENGTELKKGSEDHARIGDDVENIKVKEKVGHESERNVFWFSLIAIVMGINAVAIVYSVYAPSNQGNAIMVLLSVIAVLWTVVAVLFFYNGIKSERATKQRDGMASTRGGTVEDEKAVAQSPSPIDWRQVSREARGTTLLFFVISGILALNGAAIMFSLELFQSQILGWIFVILALLWLIGCFFFYYISLKREFRAKDLEGIDISDAHKPSFTDSEISVILFALVATLLAANSLTIYQNPDTNIGRIFLVLSVLWLYGGFVFLYMALRANLKLKLLIDDQMKRVKSKTSAPGQPYGPSMDYTLEDGEIEYERGVIWFAAVAMILALNAIVMNFSQNIEDWAGTVIAHMFVIVALIWLIGASFFMFLVLRFSRLTSMLKRRHGIGKGSIEYVDTHDESTQVLFSESYGLRGRPDYVIKRGNYMIPVEVKTGRVPRGPLFSHILQLAAYCLLLEEKHELAPPYGIIRYSNVQHEIDYTEDLKNILTSKLKDMKNIIRTGEAHRNHKRPNKCKGCSRREGCPEKLV
jgi:CRISPR-associated exonuclease Cas4